MKRLADIVELLIQTALGNAQLGAEIRPHRDRLWALGWSLDEALRASEQLAQAGIRPEQVPTIAQHIASGEIQLEDA